MNDFTKEELETLAACVSTYAKDNADDYMDLFEKICFKINNYCDHKGLIDEYLDYYRCRKCGEKWVMEND